MAKKLNKNLVIGLAVLGFAITTVGGVVMVKLLQQTDPTEFAKRADTFSEDEDWTHAYQYYPRAYRTSDDPVYLVRAADMLREMGKELEALNTYQGAVVMDPEMLGAQEKILDLQLEISDMSPGGTGVWLDVKSTAEAILHLDGQAEHPRALYAMGAALLGLKEQSPDYETQGVEYLEKAVTAAPNSVEPVRRLVGHLYTSDRDEEAGKFLETIVANNPSAGEDAAESRALLAEHFTRLGEYERAAEIYDEARALAGSDPEVQETIYARASQFWATRWSVLRSQVDGPDAPDPSEVEAALAKAVAAADDAIRVRPEGFDGYVLRAEIYRRQGDVQSAVDVLKQRLELPFLREGFQSFFTRVERFSLLIALADLHTTLAAEESRGSEKMNEFASQARMYVADALGEFQERPEASITSGKLAYVLGEFSEAVKCFERAEQQSVQINSSSLHYLALARLRLGQIGGALEAIQRAVSLPNAGAAAWATYAQILQRLERPQEALAAANDALRRDPQNREARVIRTAALESLNRMDEAKAELETLVTDQPALIAANARFLANQGQRQEAIDGLLTALENQPAEPQLVAAAASIYWEMDRPDDARALIESSLKQDPENFDLRVVELRHLDIDDADRNRRYEELVKTLPDEFDRALRLASIYTRADDQQRRADQLVIAKDLIANKATDSARRAGESAMRAIVDSLLDIYARSESMAELDKLIEEATAWNDGAGLDGAEGLSYSGRRKLIDAFLAEEKRREAVKRGDTGESERLHDQAQELYGQAIDTLQLALDKFPTSGQTYAQLGEAYLQVGRIAESRAALEKGDALLPRNSFLIKRLAQVCRQLKDEDAYASWLAQCKLTIPDDPWVMEQLLLQQESDNPREGIARREQLRTENPNDRENLLALARLYGKIGDLTMAEECLNSILPLNSNVSHVGEVAEVFCEVGRSERALEILTDAVRNVTDDQKVEAQLLVAAHYAALNDPEADAAYLAAGDIDPNERVCFAIARHFYRSGRFRLADEYLTKAEKRSENSQTVQHAMVQQLRVETAVRLDDLERAEALCAAYREDNPDDPSGIFLQAEILSAQGRAKAAIDTLSEFLNESKRGASGLSDYRRSVALFRRAQFHFNRGFWQDAIDDLVNLTAADPDALRFAPRILLSRAYLKVGRADNSLKELELVYASDPDARAVVEELVDRYIAEDRLNDADRVLTAMLNREPENVAWLTRSGEVAVKQRDRSKALANFRLAAKVSGYDAEVTNRVFKVCKTFGVPEIGIEFFEQSVPPGRRQPEMMLGYAKLLAKRGDVSETVEICRLALRRRGFDSFDFLRTLTLAIREMYGGSALQRFQDQPPEEIFQRADQHILSMIYHTEGNFAEALAINRALLESSTADKERAMLWFRIGFAHNDQGEFVEARKAYEQALELDENNLPALNNLAYLLTEELNEPADAIDYAKRAVENANASTYVETLDTLGWAYLLNGEVREAIAKLSTARETESEYVPATYHLAEAYRRNGDFEVAQGLFEEVIKTPAGGVFDEYLEMAREGLSKAKDRLKD